MLGIRTPKTCRLLDCVGRKDHLLFHTATTRGSEAWLPEPQSAVYQLCCAVQWAERRAAAYDTASPAAPTIQKQGFGFQNEWLCPAATETPSYQKPSLLTGCLPWSIDPRRKFCSGKLKTSPTPGWELEKHCYNRTDVFLWTSPDIKKQSSFL